MTYGVERHELDPIIDGMATRIPPELTSKGAKYLTACHQLMTTELSD